MLLCEQHCASSEKSSLLSKDQIKKYLVEIPLWNNETVTSIYRSFKFKNYQQTLLFVNAAADIVQNENHHPIINFGYNTCSIEFSTHSAGGVTQFDFICAAHIEQLLSKQEFQNMSEVETQQGTVIAAYRRYTLVKDIKNQLFKCQQRKAVGQVVCGDVVLWQQEGEEDCGVITAIEERRTILQRPDINNNLRIIAANIDKVFIVVAHKPELSEGLVDRYLVAAENSNLNPVILLNKTDLFSEQEFIDLKQRLKLYQDIGYTVIYTSAVRENGLDSLKELLKGNNNIFVGQSGVGKSSLINTLLESDARIGEISEATGKGKHTTTTAYLYPLDNEQGHIIDSPGVREFGLIKLSEEDIVYGFTEFRSFIGLCKFRNCAHKNEPGCALLNAVENKEITEQRWKSCQRIIESLTEARY